MVWPRVGPAALAVRECAGGCGAGRCGGQRAGWTAGTTRGAERSPVTAWPAAWAGRGVGDRGGGGAWRRAQLRGDRGVRAGGAAADVGAAGDLATAVVHRVVGGWLACQQDAPGAVAVDGKTLRGAVDADGRQVHLLAALAHGSGVVLAQRRVDAKSNEITGFRPLLEGVDLQGRVVTADALHTQTEHARYLVGDRQADYLFCVKGNQPTLEAAISHLPQAAFSPGAPNR